MLMMNIGAKKCHRYVVLAPLVFSILNGAGIW
jgi:hypothetical protein